jgi:hypothetical protein
MKSQILVIGCFVLTITSISTLLINTNLGHASAICVNKYNDTNVIPCSNQKTIDNSTRGNSTSIQEAKLYVDDAIQSLQQTQDTKTSIALLKLADQRLGTLIQPTAMLHDSLRVLVYANSKQLARSFD